MQRWYLYDKAVKTPPFYHPNVTSLRWTLEEYPKLTESELPMECGVCVCVCVNARGPLIE